jgi:c-di-GMP-binding flagellar brake protein YcgR
MAGTWLEGQERLDPMRARDARAELSRPMCPVEIGIPMGEDSVKWLGSKVQEPPQGSNDTLTLTAPLNADGECALSVGDTVLVFFCSDGPGFGFQATVREVKGELSSAGTYMDVVRVDAPRTLYKFRRRRHKRIAPSQEVQATVRLEGRDGSPDQDLRGRIEDISNGGARIRIDGQPSGAHDLLDGRPLAEVDFSFRTDSETRCTLSAEVVRWVPVSTPRHGLVLGVQWHESCTPEQLQHVSDLIAAERRSSLRDRLKSVEGLGSRRKP